MNYAISRRSAGRKCILFSALLLCGCGWKERISFKSPSGRYRAQVQQPTWQELGARVVLTSPETSKVIYEFKGDAYIDFVHCSWSSDEGIVVVLIAGTFRSLVAYDVRQGRLLDGPKWRKDIARDIADSYGLSRQTGTEESISWALSSKGLEAFRERYPRFHY